MKEKTRQHKLKRFFCIALVMFVSLTIIGAIYERIAEYVDGKTLTPPGRMVTVDGRKMHVYCTGEAKDGKPTIILDSGAGDNWESWRKVQPEIAKHTKVCSYDRSGLGFSDIAKNSHSTVIVAKELGALLKAAKVQPPYIMVGHSIGGFNIRLFTEENMGNVVGMVFVDPSLEGMESMMKSPIVKIQLKLLYPVAKYAYATGLIRILSTVNPRVMVPYATQSAVSRAGADSLRVIVTAEKEETMRSSDYDAVRKANNFGDIPITVLTAKDTLDSAPAAASGWLQWSKDLAKTSSTGKQITIDHSSHYIQIDQPQIVIDSILKML